MDLDSIDTYALQKDLKAQPEAFLRTSPWVQTDGVYDSNHYQKVNRTLAAQISGLDGCGNTLVYVKLAD